MTQATHHIPDAIIDAYARATLPYAFAVVVAAHISLCDQCRAQSEASQALGGVLLERLPESPVSANAKEKLFAALDQPTAPTMPIRQSGIFPAPVMQALNGMPPKWRMLGGGIRQQILAADAQGSLRLLYIPPGRAVPEHGHGGLELTLVLQGSFHDAQGHFHRGDVEAAHDDLNHQPVAGRDCACICLAATDAPLRFHAFLPRLLQPLFRI